MDELQERADGEPQIGICRHKTRQQDEKPEPGLSSSSQGQSLPMILKVMLHVCRHSSRCIRPVMGQSHIDPVHAAKWKILQGPA